VLVESGGGRQWPTLRLERGSEMFWISIDGEAVSRYDPLPGVQVDPNRGTVWNGRSYVCTDRGSYAVVSVAGEVNASVGDRAEYLTLTSSEDPQGWISVEQWEGGTTEVSVGRPWRIDRVTHVPAPSMPS